MIQIYLKPLARKISMHRFVLSFEEKMFITFQGNWLHIMESYFIYHMFMKTLQLDITVSTPH